MKTAFQFINIRRCLFIFLIVCSLLTLFFTAEAQSVALRRPVSPQQPMWLIHIDTWNWADPQKIIDLIPEDIRPYVVMNISLSINNNFDNTNDPQFKVAEYGYEIAKSWLRTCAENQMWAVIQHSSGGYHHFSDFDLSVYEEFYQDYPNLIGFSYAEQFWGFDHPTNPHSAKWTDRINHLANMLELSNRYGGYLIVSMCWNQWGPNINPIGQLKRVPAFAEACQQYSQNYILFEKYTQEAYQSDMESICLGSYLSGYSGNYGIRYDDTGWTDANGTHANFTMATAGAVHLEHMMLTGQTVIDGPELIWTMCFRETNRISTSDGFMSRNWETFPQFDNVSVDLFRKVIDGTVRIPSRQEVINRTKYVVINDVSSGSSDDIYSSPATLFEGLYRMDGDGNHRDNKTFFKKTGRYPTIPVVYQLNDAIANSFQFKINKSVYSSRWPNVQSKVNELNNQFPQEYTGNIYAGRHENGWVVYNPFKTNTVATGNIPFKYNTCSSIDLSLSQYTAGVIKEFSNRLDIYLNNHDNVVTPGLKTNVIKIYGATTEPSYTFTDRGTEQPCNITSSWSGGVLTLTIQHNGPVDITVNCTGIATGRLTSYTAATLYSPKKPAVYTGSRQYEAETFQYKNISGLVTNGVHEGIRNYTGQGYLQFGTNSGASVRKTVTVPSSGDYRLDIRYAVVGGNVNTIDLYVNGSRISTPTFVQQSSLSNWGISNQNLSLNEGNNTIELRANATGARTIYFDNFVVVPANGGSGVWLEAECGNVGSLWDIPQSATASMGQYIRIKPGNNSESSAPVNTAGHVNYNFSVNTEGTYNLWARVRAPSASDDSFWIRMDGGAWYNWNGITPSTEWTWDFGQSYYLSAGNHTLTVAYREDGTDIDKIYIGTNVPTGYGSNAPTCNTSAGILIQENAMGFCSVDGTIDSNHSGFTGSGFANTDNVIGTGINWRINFPVPGFKTFTFRYAGITNRPANLIVNGAIVASNINFQSTGAWDVWNTVTINANTNAGTFDVRLQATGNEGLPNIDYIELNGGNATDCGSVTAILQENQIGFCGVDGTIDNNHSGFTGSGFANTDNATGTGINWRINFPTAGTKAFSIRYASTSNRPASLMVNGAAVVSNINLQSTGAWDVWNTVTVNAHTPGGVYDVRLQATGNEGLPNIDYLEVVGGAAATCGSARMLTIEKADNIFNPQEQVEKPTLLYKEYYSITGQKLKRIEDVGAGVYIIREFMSDGSVISNKILKLD